MYIDEYIDKCIDRKTDMLPGVKIEIQTEVGTDVDKEVYSGDEWGDDVTVWYWILFDSNKNVVKQKN